MSRAKVAVLVAALQVADFKGFGSLQIRVGRLDSGPRLQSQVSACHAGIHCKAMVIAPARQQCRGCRRLGRSGLLDHRKQLPQPGGADP
jgi:hypothetical protein